MLTDWQGKRVVVTIATALQGAPIQVEGVLTQVYEDVPVSRLGIEWVEVDTTVGRPGLVRIAVDQIASARLVGDQ